MGINPMMGLDLILCNCFVIFQGVKIVLPTTIMNKAQFIEHNNAKGITKYFFEQKKNIFT